MSFSIWLPLILDLVLLALRIPVSMAFLSSAIFYFTCIATEMPLNMILSKMVSAGMNMNLMAIPFFITAGLLMNYTGITSRMMKFADLCVGHMWGGLAQVNVLLSTLMGGLCGSSNADAAMQCKMLVPEMEKRASLKEILKGLIECFWAIVMIVVLIVGLRTGIVTATEGGAVLCVLCVFVGMVIYRELHVRDLIVVAKESFASVANVFGIIISATVFGLYLTYAQIPQQITRLILGMDVGAIGFLMIVNVILLIMGMFVDSSAVLMIAVPLLYPVALQLHIHPIHFGIVCILNLSIGALTPPFGAVMYQCCNLCKIEMPTFLKQGKELLVALLAALLLVTFIPGISTLLPTLTK